MTNDLEAELYLAEGLRFRSVLVQMSETELACLSAIVKTLDTDFRLTLLREGESEEMVRLTQNLLRIWKEEVKHLVMDKEATNIWDNEGELVDPTEDSQRDTDWEDFEGTG